MVALRGTVAASGGSPVARAVLAALAVLLVAWFGVLARNHAIGTAAVTRVVSEPDMGAAEWREVMNEFERAHVLDPSSDWSLTQAQYELLRDRRAAMRLAEEVLRREPASLAAWWVVARAARGVDNDRWREAVEAVRHLNPVPARR